MSHLLQIMIENAKKNSVDINAPAVQTLLQEATRQHERQLADIQQELNEKKVAYEMVNNTLSNLQSKVTEFEAETSLLKKQLANKESELTAALAKVSSETSTTSLSSVDVANNNNEEAVQTLQEKVSALEAQLEASQQESKAAQEEIAKVKNAAMEALANTRAQAQAAIAAAKEANTGGISEDEFKTTIMDVYTRAQGTFITAVELESIEDEVRRETMQQVTKLHLKRLREVLKQIVSAKFS
jgi:chromosome segregation ATPase